MLGSSYGKGLWVLWILSEIDSAYTWARARLDESVSPDLHWSPPLRDCVMADDNATVFSDSTTLVDPSQKRCRLQRDNPCSTIIFSPARRPIYSVETTFDAGTVTTVRKLPPDQPSTVNAQDGEFVASLLWNDVLDDKVKVGNAPPVRLRKILGIRWVSLARTANFKDPQGRKYQWQGYALGMPLRVRPSCHTSRPFVLPSRLRGQLMQRNFALVIHTAL